MSGILLSTSQDAGIEALSPVAAFHSLAAQSYPVMAQVLATRTTYAQQRKAQVLAQGQKLTFFWGVPWHSISSGYVWDWYDG
jgi:hypothetical protein